MPKTLITIALLLAFPSAYAAQDTPHTLTPEEQCTLGANIAGKARSAQNQGISEDDFLKDMAADQDPRNAANVKKIADYTYASGSGGDSDLYQSWYKERCMSVIKK
jgi:hypothetical protein